MNQEQLNELLERIGNGQASDEELAQYINLFKTEDNSTADHLGRWEVQKHIVLKKLTSRLFQRKIISRQPLQYIAIAASLLLIISIGIIITKRTGAKKTSEIYTVDFKPAPNKAILTLSNGHRIVIDDSHAGQLASEKGIAIVKNEKGNLMYRLTNVNESDVLDTDIITTPRGAQHQVVLSDGTQVWLNAESSIKFPASFGKNKREVVLNGEGYFEVAKDKSRPFYVHTETQTIRVLGTHFNINAYQDDQVITTTLFEGAVSVTDHGNNLLLKPGQQCLINQQHNPMVVNCENLDAVIAWKNGQFNFSNADVHQIMKQVSRWYDVDVEYRSNKNNYRLSAEFSRNMNASKVLTILSYTGLKFKTEGRKIIVE